MGSGGPEALPVQRSSCRQGRQGRLFTAVPVQQHQARFQRQNLNPGQCTAVQQHQGPRPSVVVWKSLRAMQQHLEVLQQLRGCKSMVLCPAAFPGCRQGHRTPWTVSQITSRATLWMTPSSPCRNPSRLAISVAAIKATAAETPEALAAALAAAAEAALEAVPAAT